MAQITVDLPPETDAVLSRFARRAGVSKEKIIVQALPFLGIIDNQTRQGKKLAFVEGDEITMRIQPPWQE